MIRSAMTSLYWVISVADIRKPLEHGTSVPVSMRQSDGRCGAAKVPDHLALRNSRCCSGEQLTIQVFEDFLHKLWRAKIVFRKLRLRFSFAREASPGSALRVVIAASGLRALT